MRRASCCLIVSAKKLVLWDVAVPHDCGFYALTPKGANGKETVVEWQDMNAGTKEAAEQKFWVALGREAGGVALRINTDPGFVTQLAAFAIKGVSSYGAYLDDCRAVYLNYKRTRWGE